MINSGLVKKQEKFDASLVSIVSALQFYANVSGNKEAFVFLDKGHETSVSFDELDRFCLGASEYIANKGLTGKRALILVRDGVDFVKSFMACLYSGVVAVPVNLPYASKSIDRFHSIIDNAKVDFVFSSRNFSEKLNFCEEPIEDNKAFDFVALDDINPVVLSYPIDPLTLNDIAFIQYTSGSTGDPKGVIITHQNIIENQRMIKEGFGNDNGIVGVNWLPLYHDMGLVGNVLQPIYLGITCVHMSPMEFVQKPIRWLKAISHYRGTTCGGPNFGFDLCCKKIKDEECEGLDLSSWRTAYCGSEPVRKKTLDEFSERFAPYGYDSKAFYPCYGMAETTLIVSGPPHGEGYRSISVNKQDLSSNLVTIDDSDNAYELVSCGKAVLDATVRIVDPNSLLALPEDHVGEIWVEGRAVSPGYIDNVSETREHFNQSPKGRQGDFYRTGDFGFIKQGELYVTGRLKDTLIIRGKNYYPHDVERVVNSVSGGLRQNFCIALTVEGENDEQLVLLQEVDRRSIGTIDLVAVETAITSAIIDEFGIFPSDILFLKPNSLPKTSSGKLRRVYAKELYISQAFNEKIIKGLSC